MDMHDYYAHNVFGQRADPYDPHELAKTPFSEHSQYQELYERGENRMCWRHKNSPSTWFEFSLRIPEIGL
jgi:hypothetical protein